ncbi:MAG: PepSY-associated TM helix domain-containing protein [Bryobacteraceae bacterium]|nr:PepSY-associated TM helix domain-containing protein [Bryobacteraceae bacterium]
MTFSRLVRRIHMYLALFLAPWMLMYGVSTLAMNHRAIFIEKYGRGPAPFEVEKELAYSGSFPENAEPGLVARQILASLDLDGAHAVSRRADGTVVINRHDLVAPRRITFAPADGRLVVEKMQYRSNAFLERFHRRRGYATGYAVDNAWAVSVDLVIVAMVFWALSGLWMWWEMKVTRTLGALAAAGGIGLFALYLVTI